MAALSAHHVVDALDVAGLNLSLTPELGLKVTPASRITPELRELIRDSKDVLIRWLERATAKDAPAPPLDPDPWCWPHSTAMNAAEIDRFTMRLARFTDKGLTLADAEALADKLVIRDREGDDRRLCLECLHLRRDRRCNARTVADGPGGSLIDALPTILQRCDQFREATP